MEFLVKREDPVFSDLYPVYIVSLLNHDFFKEYSGLVSRFSLMETERFVPLLDEFGKEMLKMIFVELPKFKDEDESVSKLIKDWCRYFRYEELDEETDEDVLFARQVPDSYATDKEVQRMIELQTLRDMSIREDAWRKGEEEGALRGEEKVRVNMAVAMIQKGYSLTEISELTELTLEALKQLKKKRND